MNFCSRLLCVTLVLLAQGANARAEGFTFELDGASLLPGSGQKLVDAFYPEANQVGQGAALAQQLELQLGPQVADLAAQVRTEVDNALTPLDFSRFLRSSVNAAALAAKAMPVDYATAFQIFSLSAGGGAAIGGMQYLDELRHPQRTIDRLSNSQPPNVGVAPSLALSLGINLGAFRVPRWRYFDTRRLQLFASAVALPLGQEKDSWSVRASTYGGYLKYQVMKERAIGSRRLFFWHGLNVISGLGYSSMRLQVHGTLPSSTVSQNITTQGQTLNVAASWSGSAKLGADMRVYTIPFEVTSALQLLYVLTLYGGAAVDFNVGRASLAAEAATDAPVQITASTPGKNNKVVLSAPRPRLTYALTRNAAVVDVRGFAGLQLNAGVLALFAQVSGDNHRSGAVHAGLRGFW